MELVGWVAAVVGSMLFIVSSVMLVRANPGRRVPYMRGAQITPPSAVAMRSVGAGLLALGAMFLAPVFGYGGVVIAFAVPVIVTIAVIVGHNRTAKAVSR